LILIIYKINDIGVQNAGKLAGMNAEGAALAPSAGESPIHHSFGVFFWPAHARAFFYVRHPQRVTCILRDVDARVANDRLQPSK
jgi:hypothetical protein